MEYLIMDLHSLGTINIIFIDGLNFVCISMHIESLLRRNLVTHYVRRQSPKDYTVLSSKQLPSCDHCRQYLLHVFY